MLAFRWHRQAADSLLLHRHHSHSLCPWIQALLLNESLHSWQKPVAIFLPPPANSKAETITQPTSVYPQDWQLVLTVGSVILQLSTPSGSRLSSSHTFQTFLKLSGCRCRHSRLHSGFSLECVRDKQIWSKSKTDKQLYQRRERFSNLSVTHKKQEKSPSPSVLNQWRKTRGKKS